MRKDHTIDALDARLLLELQRDPRATVMALSTTLNLARNTVQARLTRLKKLGGFGPLGPGFDTAHLGYPLTAVITVTVHQQSLAEVSASFASIPEIVEVFGVSGDHDLLVRVVATDADDLYRIAGIVLATPGVVRTSTALVMRRLIPHRLQQLVERMPNS